MKLGERGFENIGIIYEDNHLLVAEKPVNMPSQGDKSGDRDILTALKEYIKIIYHKPGDVYLGLVHRLDRPVGGVMVFARTSKAAARLSKQIKDMEFKKEYLAVIHGRPSIEYKEGLTHFLIKDRRRNIVTASKEEIEGAKKAVLNYELIDEASHMSLVRIELITGRSHQIRVQFAHMGHPLFGDQKYGQDVNKPGQQIALWSNKLTLTHPTLREGMTFSSMPPATFPWTLFSKISDNT